MFIWGGPGKNQPKHLYMNKNLHNSLNHCLLMGINSCRRPLVRIGHVETCEESILKADLNILQ